MFVFLYYRTRCLAVTSDDEYIALSEEEAEQIRETIVESSKIVAVFGCLLGYRDVVPDEVL